MKTTMKSDIIVTKGKIIVDSSNGSHTEVEFVMPQDIADKFLCAIIDWQNNWIASFNDVEEYYKAEEEYLENLKSQLK